MAARSMLFCFVVVPFLISSVIGEDKIHHVYAVEDKQEFSINAVSTPSVKYTNIVNFDDSAELEKWKEYSDTVNTEGASKWDGLFHDTPVTKGALFFFVLYPGSSSPYAGARRHGVWNVSSSRAMVIRFFAQGHPLKYRVVCRSNGFDGDLDPVYEMRFTALNTTSWQKVTLPFDRFIPNVDGVINNDLMLNTSNITSVAIVAIGASGTSSLFIRDIRGILR